MRFAYTAAPGYGYYAEEPYFAEAEPFGYFAEEFPVPGYAEDPNATMEEYAPPGWQAQVPEMVGYGEYEPVEGYYGEYEPVDGYYGEYEPVEGYYGEHEPVDGYYGEYEPVEGYYGEPEFDGYVREGPSRFNAGCPIPTNVSGLAEADMLEAYTRPENVNATCEQFRQQGASSTPLPESFKPLW